MKEKEEKKRITLVVDNRLYEIIKEKAENDFIKPTTWLKQYLMRSLIDNNNII